MSRFIYAQIHQIWRRTGTRTFSITECNNLNENFFCSKKTNEKKTLMEFKSICHFYMTTISFIIFK